MRIVRKDTKPGKPGYIKMIPENSDDMRRAYGLIAPGDRVVAVTVCRKNNKTMGAGGRREKKVELKLVIKVDQVEIVDDFLRILGKNVHQNKYVKEGESHTLELKLHKPFELRKDFWGSAALDELNQPYDLHAFADLALILMEERMEEGKKEGMEVGIEVEGMEEGLQKGLAQILIVGKSTIHDCSLLETRISEIGSPDYELTLSKFFEHVFEDFLQHVDFSVVRCAVIASPGSTEERFYNHLMSTAEQRQLISITENKSRIICVSTKSGGKHSLKEILHGEEVMNVLLDAEAAYELQVLEGFISMLEKSNVQACCGMENVELAFQKLAIQTVFVTDELYRNADVVVRKKYAELVNSVKDSGGTVHIIKRHAAALEKYGSIAAIVKGHV